MDWVRHACYFGEEKAVFTVSVNGSASRMLALLLARVRDAYQVVCKHWGGDRIAVVILGDGSHNACVCVCPLGHCRIFPLRYLPRHLACLKMSDACEIQGEKSTVAKDNPWANGKESKQRVFPCMPAVWQCPKFHMYLC